MEPVTVLFAGVVVGVLFAILAVKLGDIGTREPLSQMTPEQEAQFELNPVYATVTQDNVDEVILAQICHVEDPENYPAVKAIEERKNESPA